MDLLLPIAGSTAVVLGIAWWVRRHHHDLGVGDDDYEGPPLIHGQGGPH